jgi:small subunit ribosomal protein S18
MASTIEQQAKGSKQGEVRYLTPLDIDTKKEKWFLSLIRV